jgi:dTDP-4-dehydrorhamnose reductase
VLVTGAGGLLGGRLAALLAERAAVTAVVRAAPAPAGLATVSLDLRDADAVRRALDAHRPAGVLHCAALADPDRCEREPALAEALNARVPEHLARACRGAGIRLVAVSTDLVFGGEDAPAAEDAAARPLSAYGRTKLAGEEAILAEAPDGVVLRVALVAGRGHGPRATASEAVAWALRAGRRVRLYEDEWRTPVDAESVAEAAWAALAGTARGRFHLGGPERVSRLELGHRVARRLSLPAQAIVAAGRLTHAGAPRAADVSLDSARARRELGFRPRPLDAAIAEGRPGPEASGGRIE